MGPTYIAERKGGEVSTHTVGCDVCYGRKAPYCYKCRGTGVVAIHEPDEPKRTILGAVIWYSILAALVTTAAILLFRR